MSKFIESLTKPSKTPTRIVNCFGVQYEFAPVLKGRFIATVEDERAIEAFISKPKLYREVAATELALPGSTDAGPTPTLSKAPKAAEPVKVEAVKTPEPAKDAEKPTPSTQVEDNSETASETQRLAQALLASTPTAIKKLLEKNCPPLPVLKAAYAIEQADPKKRVLVVSGLKAAINALEAE